MSWVLTYGSTTGPRELSAPSTSARRKVAPWTVAPLDKLLSGLRVLVVEDEHLILMMIEGWLSDLGCSAVTSAPSVDKALGLLAGQQFDVAMLDMNLGGSDSGAVAEALERHSVPFLYCTGNRANKEAKGELAHPVLKKPFSVEELAAALSRLIKADYST